MAVIIASAILPPPDATFPPGTLNPEVARETPYSISALVQVTEGGGQFLIGYGLGPFVGLSGIDLKIRNALWNYMRTPKTRFFIDFAAFGPNGLIVTSEMLFQSSLTPVPPPSFAMGLIGGGDPRPPPDNGSNIFAFDFLDPGVDNAQLWYIAVRRPHSSDGQ